MIRFSSSNAAMLLIDHQVGTIGWVNSIDTNVLKTNAIALAKVARDLKLPTILTDSDEDQVQGPLLPEFKDILPEEYANRIKRTGIVNAMDDPRYAAAVDGLGRRNLIVAGVTNDVCTVYPVLSMLEKGYNVCVVADAGGSPSKMADKWALVRMKDAGATITTLNSMLSMLAYDWSSSDGQKIMSTLMTVLASSK